MRIAAVDRSELPLFLLGGTVLGLGRGAEISPLPDLPSVACVIATPEISISTPQAFADWDRLKAPAKRVAERGASQSKSAKLTGSPPSDRMKTCFRRFSALLNALSQNKIRTGKALSGVLVPRGRGRAENPLLDLVRTGIENDFERVVFPKYPELREVKRVLERSGALYASLSGSGSAIYGLFASRAVALKAAGKLRKNGVPAAVTTTLTRPQYWKKIWV